MYAVRDHLSQKFLSNDDVLKLLQKPETDRVSTRMPVYPKGGSVFVISKQKSGNPKDIYWDSLTHWDVSGPNVTWQEHEDSLRHTS